MAIRVEFSKFLSRGKMTQRTNQKDLPNIGSDERLATLPAYDSYTLMSTGFRVALLHGEKIVEMTNAKAMRLSSDLVRFACGEGASELRAEHDGECVIMRRSGATTPTFTMEWRGQHGPFSQEDFESWARHFAATMKKFAWSSPRKTHPWEALGEVFVPSTSSIIGD